MSSQESIGLPFQAPTEVPPEIERIVTLFEEDLGDVAFPDVDLEALRAATREVQGKAEAVMAARGLLDAAAKELGESQDALRRLAERALAYAKVYASGDEGLTARLEALGPKEAPKRKRRKVAEAVAKGPKKVAVGEGPVLVALG